VCYALLSASAKQAVDQEPYDEDTYGPEAPIIWTKPVRGVVFNHKTHTMDAEMDCESCHDDLFAMEAGLAQENDDFNMESLYAGNYCGACHDGDTAFASDTRCTTCHIGVRGVARLTTPSEGAEHNAH
jgi:c(7)-type cytochrome triheme protein